MSNNLEREYWKRVFLPMKVLRNRLAQYVSLNEQIWEGFGRLSRRQMSYAPQKDIINAGENTETVFIVEQGWAVRYRSLGDGRRQIVNFMLPGDVFDLQALADLKADHSVTAMTQVEVTAIPSRQFLKLLKDSGEVAASFWWAAVQEESILREQIVRIGRRSARERICHMLLELQRRFSIATGVPVTDISLPLTRVDLADALGLTPVHVSRTLSALQRDGLLEIHRGRIQLLDRDALASLCDFDTAYLHLRQLEFPTEVSSLNGNADAKYQIRPG